MCLKNISYSNSLLSMRKLTVETTDLMIERTWIIEITKQKMFMRSIKGCLIGPIGGAVAAIFFLMPEKLLPILYC